MHTGRHTNAHQHDDVRTKVTSLWRENRPESHHSILKWDYYPALLLYRSQYIIHASLPPSPTNRIKSQICPAESSLDCWVEWLGERQRGKRGGRQKERRECWGLNRVQGFLCVCVIQSKLSQGHIETCKLKISRTGVYICCLYACHTTLGAPFCLCATHTNTRMHAWVSLNRAAALKWLHSHCFTCGQKYVDTPDQRLSKTCLLTQTLPCDIIKWLVIYFYQTHFDSMCRSRILLLAHHSVECCLKSEALMFNFFHVFFHMQILIKVNCAICIYSSTLYAYTGLL